MDLRPLGANKIGFNLTILHFNICGNLSIIRCDKNYCTIAVSVRVYTFHEYLTISFQHIIFILVFVQTLFSNTRTFTSEEKLKVTKSIF